MKDPLDVFKVQPARGDIRAYKEALFIFVELKVVGLTLGVVHISVQLVDASFKKCLPVGAFLSGLSLEIKDFLYILSSPLIDTVLPIKLRQHAMQKVHSLAITCKDDYF